MKDLYTITLLLLFSTPVFSQIWTEDFNAYPDGTTSTANWTTDATDCDDPALNDGNQWGVFGGQFVINDVEGAPCCTPSGGGNNNNWTSAVIDISQYCNISISLTISASGTLECDSPGNPLFECQGATPPDQSHDQVVAEYILNGNTPVQFGYVCGEDGLGTVSVDNLDGNTLQIRFSGGNKSDAESYFIDDIVVDGTLCPCDRAADSLTLVTFYNETGGPTNWINKWDLQQPIDTWFGVFLNAEGCVTCLDLDGEPDCNTMRNDGNGLINTLPEVIADLKKLENIYLGSNQLSGTIPLDIFNLGELKVIDFSDNNLNGPIPPQVGNLNNLQELYLFRNDLTGNIPLQIENLVNLNVFDLNTNKLDGEIPTEIGLLENLTFLSLFENLLTGPIPSELGNLQKLTHIWLFNNQLSGSIPTELGNLVDLYQLILANNKLTGNIPTELGNLNDLALLGLSMNQLTDTIPAALGNLQSLELLTLSDNQLTGNIPPELGNLENLIGIQLSDNQLTGNIPSELGILESLEGLYLQKNTLSGPIPKEIGNLVNLNFLNLSDNNLAGNIPSELGNLTNMRRAYLQNNNLTACFTEGLETICLLGFSTNTDQDGYNFTNNPLLPWQGDFERFCNGEPQIGAPCNDGNPNTEFDVIGPDCGCAGMMCNSGIDSLILVDLYNATDGASWTNPWQLDQPVSTWAGVELHASGCVRSLSLTGRNLIGSLPANLGALQLLEAMVITGNPDLTGSIPASIGGIVHLTTLNLSNNSLVGVIPPDIGDLCEVEELDISDNNLTGCFPASLSQLESLQFFDASNNLFTCTAYPAELITLCFIDSLDLINNSGLPDFEAFCMNGDFSTPCPTLPDSAFCIDTVQNLVQAFPCGAILPDSSALDFVSVGMVDINNLPFATITRTFTRTNGAVVDSTLFVGCGGWVIESCVSTPDTLICTRGVLDEMSYSALVFLEVWNCTEPPVDCMPNAVGESSAPTPFHVFPNPTNSEIQFERQPDMDLQRITCTNPLGQSVPVSLTSTAGMVLLKVHTDKAGMYILSVPGINRTYLARIVVSL